MTKNVKKVIVASKNPVKINAAQLGFSDLLKDDEFIFEGVSVPSEVSDQPLTSKETLQGAINRAENARKSVPNASFWIGIEGGIEREGEDMEVFAWVYIMANNGFVGKAKTASFYLPPQVIKLVNQGMELGEADDQIFNHQNSKQKGGSIGILTDGLIGRTEYYHTAVVLALIPFYKQALYQA